MLKKEAMEFWDTPDFKRQQELIAGSVPWEASEVNALEHRKMIETPIIKEYLFSLPRTPFVVELGCGVGRMLKTFVKEYRCVGLDISQNMLKKATDYMFGSYPEGFLSLKLIEDGLLPLPSDSVAFVYSFLVFQHIQTKAEIKKYMEEIARVLTPGGYFRVQTLKGQPCPENKFGGFHGRFYPTIQEFRNELEEMSGLKIEEAEAGLGHPEWLWLTMRKI